MALGAFADYDGGQRRADNTGEGMAHGGRGPMASAVAWLRALLWGVRFGRRYGEFERCDGWHWASLWGVGFGHRCGAFDQVQSIDLAWL